MLLCPENKRDMLRPATISANLKFHPSEFSVITEANIVEGNKLEMRKVVDKLC